MIIETMWKTRYDADLIEVPPHWRTIKIQHPQYSAKRYIDIPYTQFYFTNKFYSDGNMLKKPIVFISNSLQPVFPSKMVARSIFYGNLMYGSSQICMGNIPSSDNKLEFISQFWLSTFLNPILPLNINLNKYFDIVNETLPE